MRARTATMSESQHPYAAFLHEVKRPARYTGGERFSVAKPEDSGIASRMAFCFPDVYDIGMSHLGTKILYKVVNEAPDLALERVFCPWPDMEEQLRRRNLPLISLETRRPLSGFDIVGFSLQYELTFTNVLTMLDLGGIPLRAADRGPEDPLVLAGGPVATQPEPMAPLRGRLPDRRRGGAAARSDAGARRASRPPGSGTGKRSSPASPPGEVSTARRSTGGRSVPVPGSPSFPGRSGRRRRFRCPGPFSTM